MTPPARHLLAASVLLLAACASQQGPSSAPSDTGAPAAGAAAETGPAETPAEGATTEPTGEQPRPERFLTVAAVGDMMLGTDYPENHLPDDDGVSFLAGVAPFLAAADLTVGNLEGVLADGGEPAKACRNPQACYVFRSPTRYARYFREAGFDALSIANNHARDFGEDGRSATMQALDAVGIRHSGREGEFASFEASGFRLAFLAFAVTRDSNLLLDYELARETVAAYAADHEVVIVSFHGGAEGEDALNLPFAEEEYYGEPRGDVVLFSRAMVDAGADLVFGHGPHVVRAMERYRDRLIAYSLGNFATYYGISVAGLKGIAPILVATLDGEGRFVEGEIISTVQLRPAGPSVDPESRALNLVRGLSLEDFGNPGLTFTADGRLLPVPRADLQSSAPTDLKSTPSALSLR